MRGSSCTGAERALGNSITRALPSPRAHFSPCLPAPPRLHLLSSTQQSPSIPGGACAPPRSVLELCIATGMNLPSPPPARDLDHQTRSGIDFLRARLPRAILWYCRGGVFLSPVSRSLNKPGWRKKYRGQGFKRGGKINKYWISFNASLMVTAQYVWKGQFGGSLCQHSPVGS